MKTFNISTLGCKVNQYESQLIREQLLKAGLRENTSAKQSDLYLINTCTVTASADRESRRIIRQKLRQNPRAVIIAAGCYAEKDTAVIKEISNNILILNNASKKNILNFIPHITTNQKSQVTNHISSFKGHTKAFIKIQDGCENFCSYCKVALVRGKLKSKKESEIIHEAETLVKNGYKEIILTGICLGSYHKASKENKTLADVINALTKLKGDFRIRLSSIEINDIDKTLIGVINKNSKICKHLHIPIQSGDDSILKKMNRKYTTKQFLDKIGTIRKTIPNIAISTDLIVGFPGEGRQEFNNTVETLKKLKPMRTHIFPYSPRKATPAYNFGDKADSGTVKERLNYIRHLTDIFAQDFYNYSKNNPQRILIEQKISANPLKWGGYSDTYVKFIFSHPKAKKGLFLNITPINDTILFN